jgi:transglutaminase-like putative cysteine protease
MAVFKIVHVTKYHYNYPIKESINEIRLFPHNFDNQEVLHYELVLSRNPVMEISNDYYGNRIANFNTLEGHTEMIIESSMLVRVNHSLRIPEIDSIAVQDLASEIEKNITLLRLCCPETIKNQNKINAILKRINIVNKPVLEIAQQCNQYVFDKFTYTKGITNIETTIDEILNHKKGVCQDFAHILLQLLRTAGIPSRYVSGYICPNKSGFRGEGATHAWVEIYTPTQGWLGLDPTNNIWTMDNHVRLSVGRNFNDCTPVKGNFKGIARQILTVCVTIGYEDGRHAQELNDVQLQKCSPQKEEQLVLIEKTQQQQQ